jgi:hypothetical protein
VPREQASQRVEARLAEVNVAGAEAEADGAPRADRVHDREAAAGPQVAAGPFGHSSNGGIIESE